MKKTLLLLFAFLSLARLNAQEEDEVQEFSVKNNELMINPFALLLSGTIAGSYERILNKDYGVGVDAVIFTNSKYNIKSQFSPYGRVYFGRKYASGFFIEGFVPVTTLSKISCMNNDFTTSVRCDNTESNSFFGLGIGLGGKWNTKRNVIFQASFGLARLFGSEVEDYVLTPISYKGMLGVGFRF